MMFQRRKAPKMGTRADPRIRCPSHLKWIRGFPCSVTGCDQTPIEAAHARTGTDGAMGIKPSDIWAIPLCRGHHQEQHNIGEARFETRHGFTMKIRAIDLAAMSPHRRKWEEPTP